MTDLLGFRWRPDLIDRMLLARESRRKGNVGVRALGGVVGWLAGWLVGW